MSLPMKAGRPVNLPLPSLFGAMPVTAVTSILHRASGVVLFAGALFLCYLLDLALRDAEGFERAVDVLAAPWGKLALWLVLFAFIYHLVAGVRHLLLDFHIGDSAVGGRLGGWLSIILTVLAMIPVALWLW